MKKTIIAMLTMGIMAASCQKEDIPEVKSYGPITIYAECQGIKTETRTEMINKYDIVWSANDKLYVTDGAKSDTFTLSNGEGTSKGTFNQDGTATFSTQIQAYYPSTMIQEGNFVWPASQTTDQAIPMYSSKTISGKVEDLNFTSLGSVLQIVLNSKQEDVILKSIEVKDGSKTMSGTFTVDTEGKANITATDNAGITLGLGESGVSLGNGANFFNIAVPSGNYQNLTFTFTDKDGAKCVIKDSKLNLAYNTVSRIMLTAEIFKPEIPVGALPGKFSVSNDGGKTVKQVFFSKGNLYYDGNLFKFEDKQYDYTLGWENLNHVCRFFWSKSPAVACAGGYNDERVSDNDVFFTNETETTAKDGFTVDVNGKPQTGWRTLSLAEWKYLLDSRVVNNGKGKDKSFSIPVTYDGKRGLVLYPDDYTGDPISGDVTDLPEGVAFLPAAGGRLGTWIGNPNDLLEYWSSTVTDKENANYIHWDKNATTINYVSESRYCGDPVRLVKEQ